MENPPDAQFLNSMQDFVESINVNEYDSDSESNISTQYEKCLTTAELKDEIYKVVTFIPIQPISSLDDIIDSLSECFCNSNIMLHSKIRDYNVSLYKDIIQALVYVNLHNPTFKKGFIDAVVLLLENKLIVCQSKYYAFKNHIWNEITFIESVNLISKAIFTLYDRSDKIVMPERFSHLEVSKFYDPQKIKKVLNNISEITTVTKMILNGLEYPNFLQNQNKTSIIAFKDGVYDTISGEFRCGYTGDFISVSMGVEFNSHGNMEKLNSILNSIFPNKEILEFFLLFISSSFSMKNTDKILVIFRGATNGGKTFICTLLSHLFGKYLCRIPVNTLTGKKTNGSNATPDLMQLEHKLLAITQEPGEKDRLNLGSVKELSGNEQTIYARGLYEKAREIQIKCKIILCMNKTQIAQNLDKATENRLCVIPFESVFEEDPTLINPSKNIYQANKNLDLEIPELLPAFKDLLVEYFEKYKTKGLIKNKSIKKATNDFFRDNEPLLQFFYSNYEKCEYAFVQLNVVNETFKLWLKENYPNTKNYNIVRFTEILNRQDIEICFNQEQIGQIAGWKRKATEV
jgi:phage/plasmid-associated DNA primase